MGMSRFQQLTYAQILAVFLYGKAKDKPPREKAALAREIQKRMQRGEQLQEYLCCCTSHPQFPRLYDIAGDFSRYVEKDRRLAECYNVSRGLIYGELESIRVRQTANASPGERVF